MLVIDKQKKSTSLYKIQESEKNGYKSIFASQDISADTLFSKFDFKETLATANRFTIQVNQEQHIMLSPEILQYINHSCNPNVFFDTTNKEIVTLRNIKRGEEITFFYPSTEWNMTEQFACSCGSNNCIQQINGAAHINAEVIATYRLSDFIKEQLNQKY